MFVLLKRLMLKDFKKLVEEYNKIVVKLYNKIKQIDTMKTVNVESMLLSLKQYYGIKT